MSDLMNYAEQLFDDKACCFLCAGLCVGEMLQYQSRGANQNFNTDKWRKDAACACESQ